MGLLNLDSIEKDNDYDYMIKKIKKESYEYYSYSSIELKQNYSFCTQTIVACLSQTNQDIIKFDLLLNEMNRNIKDLNMEFKIKRYNDNILSYVVEETKPKVFEKKNN